LVHLEEVDDRQVAGGLAVGHGAGFQDEPVLGAVGTGELVDEAGLAHAGFPHEGDELAVALVGEAERAAELLDLGVAADEPRQPSNSRRVKAGPPGARSGERVDLHGVRQALDRDRAPGRDLHIALGELEGRGGEQDGAGRRHLLHAGGQVRRLTDGGVVHVQVRADGADDHLAGVEADADLEGHPVRAEDPLGIPRDRLLHPQRGIAGADGVVLVGQRGAEEGHDPVAHDLVDGAFVAVDGLHHPLEHGVEELARLLGIPVGEQLHGALEIGEEHGDLLALALQGGLGGEDLLGEVPGGVGLTGGKVRPRGCHGLRLPRVTALCAEPRVGRERGATARARWR
jgi:hypothetical protein